ncbi:MAG TPA: folylpolyglutamate synthase/dihydrofolate synthase family protein [Candidatus Bilamarchaeaceae archaeon]|nr:folylpolyglutamate synthase/dihydrofolate synthase family protein [Candidatus Bilamarchaeaceae archaeon]
MQLGLERIEKILAVLGNPEKNLRVILVAGTNGKGSVTAYLSGILHAAGYKVGSYYSPHLLRYNERFKVNGREISDAKMKKYEQWMLRLSKNHSLTLFEALTAIAYNYFSDEHCQFAVMEVGLGGRLDATNMADEEMGIITTVALDHTKELGHSLEQIAYEKAGILKNGLGIIGKTDEKSKAKIKSEAEKRNVKLKIFDNDFQCKPIETNAERTAFNYLGKNSYKNLETKLLGSHQAMNASLAVAAAENLGIGEKEIRQGLKLASIRARMEILSKKPLIIVDGAHNPHAMRQLVENLKLFKYDNLIVLFAALKDKDWKGMIDLIAPKAKMMIITQVRNPRAENPRAIAAHAARYTNVKVIKNAKTALSLARSKTEKDDLLLICGSLYLAGEILNIF